MKFQKGDKIAFYQGGVKYIGYIDVIDDNLLSVRSMGGAFFYVHVKQCRKLKKKREPRRFWINPNEFIQSYKDGVISKITINGSDKDGVISKITINGSELIEVVEVIK